MIKKLFVVFIGLIFMCGCSSPHYSWDKVKNDINLLLSNEYTIYHENTEEIRNEFNKEFYSYDLDVNVISVTALSHGFGNIVIFLEFEQDKEAKSVYVYQINSLSSERDVKFCLKENILIYCNHDEGIDLLTYKFD